MKNASALRKGYYQSPRGVLERVYLCHDKIDLTLPPSPELWLILILPPHWKSIFFSPSSLYTLLIPTDPPLFPLETMWSPQNPSNPPPPYLCFAPKPWPPSFIVSSRDTKSKRLKGIRETPQVQSSLRLEVFIYKGLPCNCFISSLLIEL